MKISFNWLREFVDVPDDPQQVGEKLTSVGLTLDALDVQGDDTILELDVTANRGDCLSHLGVAREAAAIYGKPIRLPRVHPDLDRSQVENIEVSIAHPALCGRYTARVIRGIRVGASPDWLARRLESSGIRPINNVADITNYVLLELGHPMHAFDLGRLDGRVIAVRSARPDETLTTLDGVQRRLDESMLVIADGPRPIALAGIMGGETSEISGLTRDVLLESAWFDPQTVRNTARALNLSTEASYRFERGTDPEQVAQASQRATSLILELAGGSVSTDLIDVYPGGSPPAQVHLRRDRIARYLGSPIPDPDVVSIFAGLRFGVSGSDDGWDLTPPSYRNDIATEEDLLEEVARHYGYERFPSTLPVWSGEGRGLRWQREENAVRDALEGLGYAEVCTLAFSHPEIERRFAPDDRPVALRNPLSEDEPVLRTSLVPSMLRALKWNLNRGLRDLKLCEIGKVYPSRGEYRQLVLAMTGAAEPANAHRSGFEGTFYSLKGDVEAILEGFGCDRAARQDALPAYYHPGRTTRLGNSVILGQLGETVAEEFRIRQKVYIAEVAIEALYAAGRRTVAVAPIPKYPRVRRDFSLILDNTIRFSDVEGAIRSADVRELVGVEPFDRIERGPFPESCYGLGVALEYQSGEGTLTDIQVEEFDQRVLSRLEAIGAKLRS